MLKLPLDLSTFRTLREQNYLYVDKTQHAHTMLTSGRRFFLARPRRFGKSLFVSTLKEILEGNKDLFEGLAIAATDYDWHIHGVILLDLSALGINSPETLKKGLVHALQEIGHDYNIVIDANLEEPELALLTLVKALKKKFGHVAILVDEYDSPILHALKNPELAGALRDGIRQFFAAIKGLDQYIDFVFITGISSFIKAGLFSGINNVRIVTLDKQFASACGYTDTEIDHYLQAYIAQWSDTSNIDSAILRTKIKSWYDGYHFGSDCPALYNPFSIMNALHNQEFHNYWFLSGIPTFLIDILKKKYHQYDPDNITISSDILHGMFDVDTIPLLALMFQTGYLTVTNYDEEQRIYTLDYPNIETKISFQKYLLEVFTHLDFVSAEQLALQLKTTLNNGNIPESIGIIKQLFAHIPYQLHIKEEKFYHALLQMICATAGISAQSEYSTSHGRIDLVLDLPNLFYIVEIKFKESATVALEQIEQRAYYERFLSGNKPIILLGLSFRKEQSIFEITYASKKLSDG